MKALHGGDYQPDNPSGGNRWLISAIVTLGYTAIYADHWTPWIRLELTMATVAALVALLVWLLHLPKRS